MNIEFDKVLDASGLMCPEPVMMLHKVVRETEAGATIKVISTDPSTLRDIPKFCQFLGHELLSQETSEKNYVYLIRKSK